MVQLMVIIILVLMIINWKIHQMISFRYINWQVEHAFETSPGPVGLVGPVGPIGSGGIMGEGEPGFDPESQGVLQKGTGQSESNQNPNRMGMYNFRKMLMFKVNWKRNR